MIKSDKSWISYCGLHCGDCLIYKGEIADLAKLLLRKFKTIQFQQISKHSSNLKRKFKTVSDYRRFCDALGTLDALRCIKRCKEGGGSNSCKIRKCCMKKNISGCWLCDEFEQCKHMARLRPDHFLDHIEILNKIKQNGIQAYINDLKLV